MTLISVQVNIIKVFIMLQVVKVDKYVYDTCVRSVTSCEKYGKVCQRLNAGLHFCYVLLECELPQFTSTTMS